jgi:broad specificity phosphatase PhoE
VIVAYLYYVSHPEVVIDPDVPVPDWALSDPGRERAQALVRQPWVESVGRVVSSAETKAHETATVIAGHLDLTIEVRTATGEFDRSSTGYVPAERHEELADRLFATPDRSADGWERAVDAQARMVAALSDVIADGPDDVAVVGHGGVGTLLLCHVAGSAIDRRHDQPVAGCYWTFDRGRRELMHGWRPIDRA